MLCFLLVLLTIRTCLTTGYIYPKCCDSESVLEKIQSSYNCTQDLNKRTQIVSNRTNFIDSSEEGYCVEVEKTVGLFNISGGDITKVQDLNVDHYPKCCPLDYFYNSTTHGCVKSPHKLETFFRESFVEVGLPRCKIIVDIVVHANSHLELVNSTLYSNKKKTSYEKGGYCVDRNQHNLFVVRVCHSDYHVCDTIKCVRKCCPDGQSFVNASKCKNSYTHGLDFAGFSGYMDHINDTFAIIHDGFDGQFYPLITPRFNFHLDSAGIFAMRESIGTINITKHYRVYEKGYCIEHALKKTINDYLFFRGFPQQTTEIKFVYVGVVMAISCFFLVLTIAYYCFSDERKTLFGKILVSYSLACLMAFSLLSFFALSGSSLKPSFPLCILSAFILLYLTLAAMTWMNVMCIDIYWTFGSSKSFQSRQYKRRELKRFLWYSLHGWGTPFIITLFTLLSYKVQFLPEALQVVISDAKCYLYRGDGNYAQFLYSTVPLSILILCNIILFALTASYCLQVKREISKMNDTQAMYGEKKQKFKKFRDRFGLLLKLFFIMGISFLFEVVSTFYDFKTNQVTAVIEIIWDVFNSLQGLFLFLIFIVKKRIFRKFGNKMGLKKLRKISLVSSGMTQSTSLPTLKKNECN